MFQQLLTISRNTFTESVRQPVFVVLVIAGTIGVWILPFLAGYTFDDDNKFMIDMQLSTLLVIAGLIAAFTATRVLTAELENKTVLTVMSKPVGRPMFVLGKFVGVAGALFVAHWILSADMLLMIRHRVMETAGDKFDGPVWVFGLGAFIGSLVGAALVNYYYGWNFNSTFVFSYFSLNTLAWLLVLLIGKGWTFQSVMTEFRVDDGRLLQILAAQGLLLQAGWIAVAIAIAVSARLGQVMTILVCAVIYLVGIVSDSMYHVLARNKSFGEVDGFWEGFGYLFATAAYRLTPNIQFLHLADDLTQGNHITGTYVMWVSAYTLVFIGAALALAVALFQNREIS